ncbi:MAG: hypothetical protein DBY32_11190 [Phascolarctobacterium sp.]|nr:MAG: hypothetical protein DBY32_11190 [Phascolarctobacterium sp.]
MDVLNPEKFITVKEAAAILKTTKKDRLYLLLRSGVLKGFRFGTRKWLIDKQDFDRWCEAQMATCKYPL